MFLFFSLFSISRRFFFPFVFFFSLTPTNPPTHQPNRTTSSSSQMLRGLAGAMDVTDFSIVEQWLPRAKAAVAEGPREEVEGTTRPCLTWPTERWEAAMQIQRQQQQQVLISDVENGGEAEVAAAAAAAAREGLVTATADSAAVAAAAPPLTTTTAAATATAAPVPPLSLVSSSSSPTTTTTIIRPAEVTPEVPSTVAYSAEVVGAAPAHVEELVAKREEREAARPAAARPPLTTTQPQAQKSAPLPSSPALTRASSESSGKSSTSISAEGTRLRFRAVPALHLVPVQMEEEMEDDDDEEEEKVKATSASAATRAAAATRE